MEGAGEEQEIGLTRQPERRTKGRVAHGLADGQRTGWHAGGAATMSWAVAWDRWAATQAVLVAHAGSRAGICTQTDHGLLARVARRRGVRRPSRVQVQGRRGGRRHRVVVVVVVVVDVVARGALARAAASFVASAESVAVPLASGGRRRRRRHGPEEADARKRSTNQAAPRQGRRKRTTPTRPTQPLGAATAWRHTPGRMHGSSRPASEQGRRAHPWAPSRRKWRDWWWWWWRSGWRSWCWLTLARGAGRPCPRCGRSEARSRRWLWRCRWHPKYEARCTKRDARRTMHRGRAYHSGDRPCRSLSSLGAQGW